MSRHPARLVISALIALLVLAPALATAGPRHRDVLSPVERAGANPGVLSQLRVLLSALWDGTGSILEPNGTNGSPSPRPGNEPGNTGSADTGSGLEPNG